MENEEAQAQEQVIRTADEAEARELFIQNVEKLNDRIQQLALVGIGIIWLFRIEEVRAIGLRQNLFVPVLLFVITLALDLFHYFGVSHTWYRELKKKNSEDLKADKRNKNKTPITARANGKKKYRPKDLNLAYSVLLWVRMAGLGIGYVFLFIYFYYVLSPRA